MKTILGNFKADIMRNFNIVSNKFLLQEEVTEILCDDQGKNTSN